MKTPYKILGTTQFQSDTIVIQFRAREIIGDQTSMKNLTTAMKGGILDATMKDDMT